MLVVVCLQPVTGFAITERVATCDWCNEAESSSLPLRLASSLQKASAAGSPSVQPLRQLHVERAIHMASSFHLARLAAAWRTGGHWEEICEEYTEGEHGDLTDSTCPR